MKQASDAVRRPGPDGEATDRRDLAPRLLRASLMSTSWSIMAAPRLLGLSFIAPHPHAGSGGGADGLTSPLEMLPPEAWNTSL